VLDLIPGVGIGQARFGMTETEVRLVFGAPDKVYEGDGVKHLHFNEIRSDLWIDLEDHQRFEWVACANPEALVFGRSAVGRPLDEVLEFVAAELEDTEIEFEDFGSFESHTFSEHWFEFQAEFGVVTCVSLGNLFDENDEPIWPS